MHTMPAGGAQQPNQTTAIAAAARGMWAHLPEVCSAGVSVARGLCNRLKTGLCAQAAMHTMPTGGTQQPNQTAAVAAAARGMWAHLPEVRSAGVSGRVAALWTGVGATLARDVPFSALYWQVTDPRPLRNLGCTP